MKLANLVLGCCLLLARPAIGVETFPSDSSLLKKGTGSEPSGKSTAKTNDREVPVPFSQQADRSEGAATLQPIVVPEEAARSESIPPAEPAAPASKSGSHRLNPPEMVAEALTLPSHSTLQGQPLTLLRALSATPDRGRQLEIAKTYWRLTQAVANYHFALEHADALKKLSSRGDDATMRTARASSVARLREAELEAADVQHELAALLSLPPSAAALPLPSDRPHVGPYRTKFQELFAGRTAPDSAQLAERVLPIWRQAIDDRAAAVQAAEDALAAAIDDHAARTAEASAVVHCDTELARQQRAFIHAVCDYNRQIAEYGLIVAAPGVNPQVLVSMLIGTASEPLSPAIDPSVQPAGLIEPVPVAGVAPLRNEPTPAPPRDEYFKSKKSEPTPAPPREIFFKAKKLAIDGLGALRPEANQAQATAAAGLLYPALVDAEPAVRAKQLTVALHWDRSLPEGIGKPMNLPDCLAARPRRGPTGDHRGLLASASAGRRVSSARAGSGMARRA